jgi:hypothetical protein
MITRKALATISGLFGRTIGKAIPPENLEGWEVVLSPLSDELAVQAAMEVVRTRTETFDVAPGAVYQAAMKILNRRQPSEGEAWHLAREIASGNLDRGDLPATVMLAIEQIGWQALREVTVDDSVTRAHFLSFYRESIARTGEQRLSEFAALNAGTTREVLSRPTREHSLPAPQDDDEEGPYVPIGNLREEIARMGKEVQ